MVEEIIRREIDRLEKIKMERGKQLRLRSGKLEGEIECQATECLFPLNRVSDKTRARYRLHI